MAKTLLIINGPGLADLNKDENASQSAISLAKTQQACSDLCDQIDVFLDFRQSENVKEIYQWIVDESNDFDGLIINPASKYGCDDELYSDALNQLVSLNKPTIEVHFQNIFHADSRLIQPLHVKQGKIGFVCGLGVYSYLLAIKAIAKDMNQSSVA